MKFSNVSGVLILVLHSISTYGVLHSRTLEIALQGTRNSTAFWSAALHLHKGLYVFTSPPIGGGRGIVMPMSVCPCFRKISMCNISVISQPTIMKLDIHIEYGYSVTDKYFRSKVKVISHRNVFPRNSNL